MQRLGFRVGVYGSEIRGQTQNKKAEPPRCRPCWKGVDTKASVRRVGVEGHLKLGLGFRLARLRTLGSSAVWES